MQRALLKTGTKESILDTLVGWRKDFFTNELKNFMELCPLAP